MNHALDCLGCGEPLPVQVGRRGSLLRFHSECQTVKRKWRRLERTSVQLNRYRALRAAGESSRMAMFGATSPARAAAVLASSTSRESRQDVARAGSAERTSHRGDGDRPNAE